VTQSVLIGGTKNPRFDGSTPPLAGINENISFGYARNDSNRGFG
jgi:hypothetical protein